MRFKTNRKKLKETIEVHDTLNSKLFDGNKLKPEVSQKIKDIVDEFLKGLEEDEIKINVEDIQLVGSNVSYNYTKDSDLDVHIIATVEECDGKYLPLLYSAYRSIWNSKIDIDFYGIPVELYVDVENQPKSNGIYSVTRDEWIKEPVKEDIPDYDKEEFEKQFQVWEDKYFDLIDSIDNNVEENLKEGIEDNKLLSKISDELNKYGITLTYIKELYGDWKCKLSNGKVERKMNIPKTFNLKYLKSWCKMQKEYFDGLREDLGESLNEELDDPKIEEIDNLIEDIYELRKQGLENGGEYSIENLVFKEFRNLGYLDNLKDLKNVLIGKDLSLEGLNEDLEMSNEYDNEGNQLSVDQSNFFKNSKVRDNQGKLLVVYHGSKSKEVFDTFKYDPDNQTGKNNGKAFYFTTDKQKAQGYSVTITNDKRVIDYMNRDKELQQQIINTGSEDAWKNYRDFGRKNKNTLSKLIDDEDYTQNTERLGHTKECYLNITNPYIKDAKGKYFFEINPYPYARKKGCDGIIIYNVIDNPRGKSRPMDVYVVFNENQIKSTTNLNPTSSNNINESLTESDDIFDINEIDLKECEKCWILEDGKVIPTFGNPHYMFNANYEDDNNYVRCNFGYERYIGLPDDKLSNSQYKVLLRLLDYYFKDEAIEVNCSMNNKGDFVSKIYSPKDYTSDDIIKKIKRYYSSGTLYESLNESRYKGQTELRKVLIELSKLLTNEYDPTIDYDVHHMDGDHNNNSIENLGLISHKEHGGVSAGKLNIKQCKTCIYIGKILADIIWRDGVLEESISKKIKRVQELLLKYC